MGFPYWLAVNALQPISPLYEWGFMAENIIYDSVTSLYWLVFEARQNPGGSGGVDIRLASAPDLSGPWTLEPGPVITDPDHSCGCPHIMQSGGYYYIYYAYYDDMLFGGGDIYVQWSDVINSGYSASGISNPVLARTPAAWDGTRLNEPYIYYENPVYYLFYMGDDGNLERTGYATSSSPTGPFTKYASNPILPADGYPHGWDNSLDQAADPFVFKVGNTYFIGVSSGPEPGVHTSHGAIGFYMSTDLVNFTHYTGNPVLKASLDTSAWDGGATVRGAVTEFSGVLYESYTGTSYGNYFTWRLGITILSMYDALMQFAGRIGGA
jgi:hypothetical protein